MSSTPSNPEVRLNPASSRYETEVDGHLAVVDYTLEGDRMTLTRTFVPPELRGHGVAELLVRAALETARAKGLRIVPQCSYVARFIERNAGYQTLLVG